MIRKDVIEKIKTEVPSQPYTTEELSFFYGITKKTLLKWIAPFKETIGNKVGWYFNIRQVNVIFENLGRSEKQV